MLSFPVVRLKRVVIWACPWILILITSPALAAERCTNAIALQLVAPLREDNPYRVAVEHGNLGAGVHEAWMNEMAERGVKEARFHIGFTWSDQTKETRVLSSGYFTDYGETGSEIRDVSDREFDQLRKVLEPIALQHARFEIPKILKQSGYRNAAGSLEEVLLNNECLPISRAMPELHDLEQTELMRASQEGDVATVKSWIAQGKPLNAKDQHGWSALLVALNSDSSEIARMLVEGGADVNLSDATGSTPLMLVTIHNNTEMMKLLIQHGAKLDIADRNGFTPLMLAASYGNLEATRVLIANGADVNLRTSNGRTALSEALKKKSQPVIDELLRSGAHEELVSSKPKS